MGIRGLLRANCRPVHCHPDGGHGRRQEAGYESDRRCRVAAHLYCLRKERTCTQCKLLLFTYIEYYCIYSTVISVLTRLTCSTLLSLTAEPRAHGLLQAALELLHLPRQDGRRVECAAGHLSDGRASARYVLPLRLHGTRGLRRVLHLQ